MPVNKEFTEALNTCGFELSRYREPGADADKDTLKLAGRLGAALRYVEKSPEARLNKRLARMFLDDDNPGGVGKSFSGGSPAKLRRALNGQIDMKPFQKAFDVFLNSGLRRDLETVTQNCTPKRTRRLSEHDGEWQFDRRWEITPFQATHVKRMPTRTLTIMANFTVSAWGKSEEIDRYGAIVWAISQLIEKAGISTRIVWYQHARTVTECGLASRIEIECKRAGEYLAPSLLAACFTTMFYRRVGFALEVASGEAYGKTVRDSLGSPIRYDPVKFEKGVLSLAPECVHGYDAELGRCIVAAIKGGNSDA